MNFRIHGNDKNSVMRMRELGYAPYRNREGKESFVRRLRGADFPRFHLYINEERDGDFLCSLHLDQVGPLYLKGKAHKADYDSPEVEAESKRLESS